PTTTWTTGKRSSPCARPTSRKSKPSTTRPAAAALPSSASAPSRACSTFGWLIKRPSPSTSWLSPALSAPSAEASSPEMGRLALLLALILGAASPLRALPDLSDDGILRDTLWKQLLSKPKGERPKVGLVLSAGSLRATAHVGVISVLTNAAFPVDVVAGTSM